MVVYVLNKRGKPLMPTKPSKYRKTRFNNIKRSDGWLVPSVQHKLNSHMRAIKLIRPILPISKVIVETAAFDTQKIKNPDIEGTNYQKGEQKAFCNVREYVFYRDGHTCQACIGKSKDKVLNVHHFKPRAKGGTDRPENLITLCVSCHNKYYKGKIELKVKPSKEFKTESFMSMIRWKLVNILRELSYNVLHTYGYITKSTIIALKLAKSHINDAFRIAKGKNQKRTNNYLIKFVRKCNRSLFKANQLKGSVWKRNTIKEAFEFKRFDKVLYGKTECFIYGLRISGYSDLKLLTGYKIGNSVKYNLLKLLESFKSWRIALLLDLKKTGYPSYVF